MKTETPLLLADTTPDQKAAFHKVIGAANLTGRMSAVELLNIMSEFDYDTRAVVNYLCECFFMTSDHKSIVKAAEGFWMTLPL